MLSPMSPLTVRVAVSNILKQKGLNTRDFANKAGISYNTALSWERGYPTRIDMPIISKICQALEVQPGDLFVVEDTETQ